MPDQVQQVCLGVVISAHGTKGEVNVRSDSGTPEGLAAYGAFSDEDGKTLKVAAMRQGPKGPVLRFAGVADRNSAEALKGTRLFVGRDQLPDLESEEYYHSDLVGMAVKIQGKVVGKVTAVHNFGAGDIIEVARTGRKSVMLPFTREIVPKVDIPGGALGADPPPGYFDAKEDGNGQP